MMDAYKTLESELQKLPKTANERSLYTSLNNFFKSVANNLYNIDTFFSVSEESGYSDEKHIGFPDLTVRKDEYAVGWVEVKHPREFLNSPKHQEQFDRYKSSFENLIITNLKEWQLWRWNDNRNSIQVKSVTWNACDQTGQDTQAIFGLIQAFLEGIAQEVQTPKQLAVALARKTQVLRDQVLESYQDASTESPLIRLKSTFETTLIQNISEHRFANMVAETLAYSLFLAKLEYKEQDGDMNKFGIEIVERLLPKNVPVLKDLYGVIQRVSQDITPINQAVELLVQQLNVADMQKIRHKLTQHKQGEDPVIQFYEPFLNAYDPEERKARGVYYTPKPLVDYIVRGVDYLLQTKFHKKLGFADETVEILDPATGSGTFLMSAVQQAHHNIEEAYSGLGKEEVLRHFQHNVLSHILKHFYGFELMIAPYAVAHLKLSLELERMGFKWEMTESDGDPDNDRIGIYLANSLDSPNQPPKLDFPGFHLAEESNRALEVKRKNSILAIIGNPPYSGISMNMQPEMRKLVEQYKYIDGEKIKEKGALQLEKNLNDDYVKFIAFAEKMIAKSQSGGIVAFVTNNGYLTNKTLRGMRKKLIDNFDKIYIYNLYGATQNKPAPNDQSVFNIQLGTAVCFLIKNGNNTVSIKYRELIGPQTYKLSELARENIDKQDWINVTPAKPFYNFMPSKDPIVEREYDKGFDLGDLFIDHQVGIISASDSFFINSNARILEDNFEQLKGWLAENKEQEIRALGKSTSKKVFKNADHLRILNEVKISKFSYRLFDDRYIINEPKIIEKPQTRTWNNFADNNIGLVVTHQVNENYSHIFISNKPIESGFISNKTKEINYIFRIYNSGHATSNALLDEAEARVNINRELAEQILGNAGIEWDALKRWNAKDSGTASPLDIADYCYAILHSNGYRSKYANLLKSGFPKIPKPSNKGMFWGLVHLGSDLRRLHLLGDDPFSSEPTILDDSRKWGIQPGGQGSKELDWLIDKIEYDGIDRVYINDQQYFKGIEPRVWNLCIGGYQVLNKWLKDRKSAGEKLTTDRRLHYVKIAVVLRETLHIQKKIDAIEFMQ